MLLVVQKKSGLNKTVNQSHKTKKGAKTKWEIPITKKKPKLHETNKKLRRKLVSKQKVTNYQKLEKSLP